LVRFHGVLAQEQLPGLYLQNDVFILTSDYEGLPLSLLEAMGHGCVPVVTDIPSGIPEVLRDGINGYLVPVGATAVFADRLAALYRDQERRCKLAQNAYATVAEGGYRIDDMASRYTDLFRDIWRKIESGAYHRPWGRVRMPPFMGNWKDRLPAPLRVVGIRCKGLIRRVRSSSK
jgi:glycosyltransferase involved in cell wall biosynthesis